VFELGPKDKVPVPSAAMLNVAPVTDWLAGLPLPAAALCPYKLTPASCPAPAPFKLKMALRAFAAFPPGNSNVTAQYGPLNAAAAVGAGTATNRSNVLVADSVL